MLNAVLWQKLQSYPLGASPTTSAFSSTLAREQGWSEDFTVQAIEEYRRFLYLSQVSKTPVTPSVTVDKVWHHHLMHTRDYWDELCDKVLGRPLHHDPATGRGAAALHLRQYEATRALYAQEFGREPPSDIWRPGRGFVRVSNNLLAWGAMLTLFGMSITTTPIQSWIKWGMLAVGVSVVLYWSVRKIRERQRRSRFEATAGGCAAGCGGWGTGSDSCGDSGGDGGGSSDCGGGGCGGD